MPQAQGIDGIFQASQAATLVGLEVPGGTPSFDVKPYVISDLSSQAVDSSSAHHVVRGDYGLDVKTTLSQGLTADLTYNTDFAQVEADEQQVNLTRFSLFFPEKREFFLENQGLFQFGGSTGSADVPVLFYSRRIGLDEGRAIPIQGGGRLTGRLGAFSLGLVDIRTGEDGAGSAPTNFSVVRLKRDLLRRVPVGVLFARRSVALGGPGASDHLRCGRGLRVLRQPGDQHLLGPDAHRRAHRRRHEPSAAVAVSRGIATGWPSTI